MAQDNSNVAAAKSVLRAIKAKQGGDDFGYAPKEVASATRGAISPPSQGSGGKRK